MQVGGLYVTIPEGGGGNVDGLEGALAVHHVQLDQVVAAPGQGQYSRVSNQRTASHRQLTEPGQHLSQLSQSIVRNVTLPHIQGLEPGAAVGEGEDGGVCDGLAASCIKIAQLVAMAGEVAQSSVRDTGTLGDRQVSDSNVTVKLY